MALGILPANDVHEDRRYEWGICSVQAQSPRQSECCAELGREPSDGEPANPRSKIMFACLFHHKREQSQCPLCANSGHSNFHSITSSARTSSARRIVSPEVSSGAA